MTMLGCSSYCNWFLLFLLVWDEMGFVIKILEIKLRKVICSLGDIIGTIVNSGFTEGLLDSAQTTPIIQNTNIGYIKEINV